MARGRGRVPTVAPRNPLSFCSWGLTLCSKCWRYKSTSAGVVCADQKRAIMSGGLGGPLLDPGPRRLVTDHNCPVTDLPVRHQAIFDVRVVPGEGLDGRRASAVEDDQGAVGRIGQGACQQQLAASVRLAGQVKVLIAEDSATPDKIIDYFVEKRVISHFHLRLDSSSRGSRMQPQIIRPPTVTCCEPPAIEGTSRTRSPSLRPHDSPPRKRISSSLR